MNYNILYLLTLAALASRVSFGMKVNVEGTLSLGKEVIDAVSQLIGMTLRDSRRSLITLTQEDPITSAVRTTLHCNDIESCKSLKKFLEEYIIIMAKSLQNILDKGLGSKFRPAVYEKQVEFYLEVINGIIILDTGNEVYDWIDRLKKICSKFQELASIFIKESEWNSKRTNSFSSALNQKIILATVIIETKYLNTLCAEHKFCMKSYKMTNALLTILEVFNTTTEDKTKIFVRALYKNLYETSFYIQINEATAHQLQVILDDMATSKDTSVKTFLSRVQDIVNQRLRFLKTNQVEKIPHEARLLHSILSDLDHIYDTEASGPFLDFFKAFYDWVKFDVPINNSLQKVLSDINAKLAIVSNDLFIKLINEVNTLLDLVIPPQ